MIGETILTYESPACAKPRKVLSRPKIIDEALDYTTQAAFAAGLTAAGCSCSTTKTFA